MSALRNISFSVLITSSLIGCSSKKNAEGFKVVEGPIQYQSKQFDDPNVLAEVNGTKFFKSQILDKSVVLTDLMAQENSALVARVVARAQAENKLQSNITIFSAQPKDELIDLLKLYGVKVEATPHITFSEEKSEYFAQVGDSRWTREELKKSDAFFVDIEKRKAEETAHQLNSQISRILVNQESMKNKMSIQEFVKKVVNGGNAITVSDAEMNESLAKLGIRMADIDPKSKEKVREGLAERKQQLMIEQYAQNELIKGDVAVSFAKPDTQIALDKNWAPIAGYEDAPVEMVAFASADCEDCKSLVKNVNTIVTRNDGHLKVNWIHAVPEDSSLGALMAESALCLESQKKGSSLQFLNDMAPKAQTSDESTYATWAKSNGLSDTQMRNCLLEGKQKPLLEKHRQYASKVGVNQNPKLWVSGQFLSVNSTIEQIQALVDSEKERTGSSWWSAKIRQLKNKLGF